MHESIVSTFLKNMHACRAQRRRGKKRKEEETRGEKEGDSCRRESFDDSLD